MTTHTPETMSYAGPATSRSSKRPTTSRVTPTPSRDWNQLAVFGAGLALGMALGAGVALLTAEQDGAETRADLRQRVGRTRRMIGHRSRTAWIELRDEIRRASRALTRKAARAERETEAEPDVVITVDA